MGTRRAIALSSRAERFINHVDGEWYSTRFNIDQVIVLRLWRVRRVRIKPRRHRWDPGFRHIPPSVGATVVALLEIASHEFETWSREKGSYINCGQSSLGSPDQTAYPRNSIMNNDFRLNVVYSLLPHRRTVYLSIRIAGRSRGWLSENAPRPVFPWRFANQ